MSEGAESFHDALSLSNEDLSVFYGEECGLIEEVAESSTEKSKQTIMLSMKNEDNVTQSIIDRLKSSCINKSKEEIIQIYVTVLGHEIEKSQLFTNFPTLISENAHRDDVYKIYCMIIENLNLTEQLRNADDNIKEQTSLFRDWMKYFQDYERINKNRYDNCQKSIYKLKKENNYLREEIDLGKADTDGDQPEDSATIIHNLVLQIDELHDKNKREKKKNIELNDTIVEIQSKHTEDLDRFKELIDEAEQWNNSLEAACNKHANTILEYEDLIQNLNNEIKKLRVKQYF